MTFKPKPIYLALSGFIIVLLFWMLPMDPGYELALALVPMFFVGIGILLSLIYWALRRFFKHDFRLLFYLFLFGNVIWGSLLAIDMAFDTFNF